MLNDIRDSDVHDYVMHSINHEDYDVSVITTNAGVLYLHKPSLYLVGGVSLLHRLIGVDHSNEANDIFDGFIFNIILHGIFYNYPIGDIEQSIAEYMFNTYSTHCDNDKTIEILHVYINDVRKVIDKLVERITAGYEFYFDIIDNKYHNFYYIRDLSYYIKCDKANIKFNIYLLTRKSVY